MIEVKDIKDIVSKESEKITMILTIKGLKIELTWYRGFTEEYNDEWTSAKLEKVIWYKRPYSETILFYRDYTNITRGGKKMVLAKIRRKYGISKEEWQKLMGVIGSFLSNPLRFLLRHGIEPRRVRLIDLYRAGLI